MVHLVMVYNSLKEVFNLYRLADNASLDSIQDQFNTVALEFHNRGININYVHANALSAMEYIHNGNVPEIREIKLMRVIDHLTEAIVDAGCGALRK